MKHAIKILLLPVGAVFMAGVVYGVRIYDKCVLRIVDGISESAEIYIKKDKEELEKLKKQCVDEELDKAFKLK